MQILHAQPLPTLVSGQSIGLRNDASDDDAHVWIWGSSRIDCLMNLLHSTFLILHLASYTATKIKVVKVICQSICKDIQTSGTRPSSCLPLSRDLQRYQRVALEHLNSLIHAALPTVVPCSDPTEVSECLLGSLQDPNGQERNAH